MSDFTNDRRYKGARSSNSTVATESGGADEWYDQGFDFGDEAEREQNGSNDAFGINPDLLNDATAQISEASKHRIRSDADINLSSPDGKGMQIRMDPIAAKQSFSPENQSLVARTGDIVVGGEARNFDRQNARLNHTISEYLGPKVRPTEATFSGSVYSDNYLEQREQAAIKAEQQRRELEAARAAQEAAEYDEYRTVVRRKDTAVSAEDSRFIHNLQAEAEAKAAADAAANLSFAGADEQDAVLRADAEAVALGSIPASGNFNSFQSGQTSVESAQSPRRRFSSSTPMSHSDYLGKKEPTPLKASYTPLGQSGQYRKPLQGSYTPMGQSENFQQPLRGTYTPMGKSENYNKPLRGTYTPMGQDKNYGQPLTGQGYTSLGAAAQRDPTLRVSYTPMGPNDEHYHYFKTGHYTPAEPNNQGQRAAVASSRAAMQAQQQERQQQKQQQQQYLQSLRKKQLQEQQERQDQARKAREQATNSRQSFNAFQDGGYTSFADYAHAQDRDKAKAAASANSATDGETDTERYASRLYGSSIGDSALEQDAATQAFVEQARAYNSYQQQQHHSQQTQRQQFLKRQGNADRVPSETTPENDEYSTQGAAETRKQLALERAQAVHPKPKSNSEKTLEELAKEYPGLSPEHLVKLKRSSNRCHLVSRTPIFDANSNISMYELKFTAGKVFQVNALKSDHVYHVLFGYFIRRGISCFIGRNRKVLVMMPITYDFLDYIDRYSVNRVVLRICPEQPVTPSALHILTKLRRSGMSFAIDLMILLKKDWNKAVLSIEYVMIDLSGKVKEQLNVFNRLKIKAPWLKTIGYNDVNGDGYAYLAKHMIDLLDAPFWNAQLNFNQDVSFFEPMQREVLDLIRELFEDQPDYSIFKQFLRSHEALTRDMAVFLYRFRHASPRQVQNIGELYNFLLDYSPSRSFAVMAGRALMLHYIKHLTISSQYILQEQYAQAVIRGYFVEYISKIFDDPFVERFAFQSGMFSLLHLFLLKDEVEVLANDDYADIFDRIYGESELMADIIECVQAIESTNLNSIFDFIQKYHVPPASVLISYEKALMRTNELLLVLNIVATRK